jgi:hypothetical protein
MVKVLDSLGNPILNKTVVAFTWPEPSFGGAGSNYYLSATKFCYLTGSVSSLSDKDGVAKFENLIMLGCTYSVVYIHFVCDGAARVGWMEQPS